MPRRAFAYGTDGELRLRTDGTTPARRYVTRDWHVDLTTERPVVHYRFGGLTVAWASGAGLRFVLSDRLGSAQAELGGDGTALGHTRQWPFGGSTAVDGAADLAGEERYTGQRRTDDGNGSALRELYRRCDTSR